MFNLPKYFLRLFFLGMDDYEVCNPLKSKKGIHKTFGVYGSIRNVPPNLQSKVNNIFLVALVSSEDLKDDKRLNDVNEIICDDLIKLEKYGVQLDDGTIFKAALVNISCDNLGANTVLGFVKSFSATYYCRICSLEKKNCDITVHEVSEKLRTTSSHEENVQKSKSNANPSLKLKLAEGVRMDCAFNSLTNFDMFDNVSLDIMHDMHEGIVHSFLTGFFNKGIEVGAFTEDTLIAKVRDFPYGELSKKNKPSKLDINKKILGQNASQSYCLILHLPFILYNSRQKLSEFWPTLEALLICYQIVMSNKITDRDLDLLGRCIDKLLNGLIVLNGRLIPKAHNLTHYVNAIRKIGPLIFTWMMRYEAKHRLY